MLYKISIIIKIKIIWVLKNILIILNIYIFYDWKNLIYKNKKYYKSIEKLILQYYIIV